MDWKYFIPHVWDRDRQVWEDIYLLPVDSQYTGQAVWLTIDALGIEQDTQDDSHVGEAYADRLRRLGNADVLIDGTDMLVRCPDFTKSELLEFVRFWLHENGHSPSKLIEAPANEFRSRAMHVDVVEDIKR